MIPNKEDQLINTFSFVEQPSKTFHLNRENNFIAGHTDGLEAVRQAVYLLLNVERYEYVIYSWNYGVELADLFGKPMNYVCAVLPSRIREALQSDERIEEVDNFSFERQRHGTLSVTFTVHTKFGAFEQSTEVNL